MCVVTRQQQYKLKALSYSPPTFTDPGVSVSIRSCQRPQVEDMHNTTT